MTKPSARPLVLSEENAVFIARYTSMSVAARDAQNRPVVARALGCSVSADRRRLTIYLSAGRAGQLLVCLRENGAIALAVARPKTHETLQFKGTVVKIGPPSPADQLEITAYRESFVQELESLGYRADFTRELVAGSEDSVAVVFEPATMFNQTPGPKAGTLLEGRQ